MKEPDHVAACVEAMAKASDVPVTVKCRIGIDEQDDFDFLDRFVGTIADSKAGGGCQSFIIHARKAWLKGLSPKQNRDVPVLDYERVLAIKEKYPQLRIILNGGIVDIDGVQAHIETLDGVMIGREAYSNPYFLAEIEGQIFDSAAIQTREEIARAMIPYARSQADKFGTPIKSITRHILGLYHHQSGAKAWKRVLSTLPYEDDADASVIEHALEAQKEAAFAQSAA